MKLRAYSIYDRKALCYHLPFFAVSHGVAVRTFSDAMADSNSMFSRHPMDYVLYCVGEFDDSQAAMMPMWPLEHVIDAQALVRALQSEIPFPDKSTTTRPSMLDGSGNTTSNGEK